MGTKNITINATGVATPDNPGIHRASANGDNSVKWQSGSGTHTITNLPSGIFTVDPPSSITVSPGNPSPTYTVKSDATDGEYTYNVDGGSGTGLPGDGSSPKVKIEP